MKRDRELVDGFLYSASMLYLPTTYRASALANMEVLRKARGYRTRWYLTPEDLENPVAAYSQMEYQVQCQPGSYVWGVTFSAPFAEVENASSSIFIQVTDDCTETHFFSDYTRGVQFEPVAGSAHRHPVLIMPRIVGQPGTLSVELYNSAAVDIRCQLALLVAEPCVPPHEMIQALQNAGVAEIMG
jgi:hypothetical protein